MANKIQLLPDVIASQIAAGEVIQRPASCVKELLENAIDAGADQIHLIVQDSGKTLIQVIDNGVGMSPADARLCLERHATSKIQTSEDLFKINTLGFRGEALASISAVSMLDLITRREEDEVAVHLRVVGTEVESQDFVAAPKGTNIKVRNLFYNVPARRKFLKSDSVELKHIFEEFQRVVIPYPQIQFFFTHNNKEQYHLLKSNLRQRVTAVLGKNYNERLVPIEEETELVRISGFVGKPEFARKTRGDQFFFVNHRFFKSPYLHHAVMSAFDNLIQPATYPSYAIFLEIDPGHIDVNVHPTKQEIKFENERLVYNYLKVTIRHALGKYGVIPGLDFEQDRLFNIPSPSTDKSFAIDMRKDFESSRPKSDEWKKLFETVKEDAQEVERGTMTIDSEWDNLQQESKHISAGDPVQILQRYILSPIKNGFLLIDQKSAKTRIFYERFRNKGVARPGKQRLLFPETLHLESNYANTLIHVLEDINAMGFELEHFGQDSFILHAVPDVMGSNIQAGPLLTELVEEVGMNISDVTDLKAKIADILARKVSSIVAIHLLSVDEMKALIDELFACEDPFRTPSGKLCFIQYDGENIEKLFNS